MRVVLLLLFGKSLNLKSNEFEFRFNKNFRKKLWVKTHIISEAAFTEKKWFSDKKFVFCSFDGSLFKVICNKYFLDAILACSY